MNPLYPNNLKTLIKQAGYTMAEVASELDISDRTMRDWCAGNRVIRVKERARIAQLIGCYPEDLAPLTAPTLSLVNEDTIIRLESDIRSRWQHYYTDGAIYVLNGLEAKLHEIATVTKAAEGISWQKRLHILLSLGYQLLSCVHRDLMNYRQSHIAYQQAYDVARSLDDIELMASALARCGVTLNQQGKAQEAIIYFTSALNILDSAPYVSLHGNIYQGLSEAYAKANQATESRNTSDKAEKYLTFTDFEPERSLIRGSTVASIKAQRGVNSVLLKDHRDAIIQIDESLKTYDPSLKRGRARLLAQKAEAYYGLNVLDACIINGEEALNLALDSGSSKVLASLKTLHSHLSQSSWGKEPSVVEFGTLIGGT